MTAFVCTLMQLVIIKSIVNVMSNVMTIYYNIMITKIYTNIRKLTLYSHTCNFNKFTEIDMLEWLKIVVSFCLCSYSAVQDALESNCCSSSA